MDDPQKIVEALTTLAAERTGKDRLIFMGAADALSTVIDERDRLRKELAILRTYARLVDIAAADAVLARREAPR